MNKADVKCDRIIFCANYYQFINYLCIWHFWTILSTNYFNKSNI